MDRLLQIMNEKPLIESRPVQPAKPEKSITEKQEQAIPGGIKWMCEFTAYESRYIIADLEAEWDYRQKNWHFIPKSINEAFRHEYGGHKVIFIILCIDDKQALLRLERKLKKWVKGTVQWIDATKEENSES